MINMKDKAFTIVELLMVVVIVGALAAMLYPQFQSFIIRARLKEVANTVQLIVAGEKYYFFKTGFYYDFSEDGSAGAGGAPHTHNYEDAEANLNITIPRKAVNGFIYEANVLSLSQNPLTYVSVNAYAIAVLPYDQYLYRYYILNGSLSGKSDKNSHHPYALYINADLTDGK